MLIKRQVLNFCLIIGWLGTLTTNLANARFLPQTVEFSSLKRNTPSLGANGPELYTLPRPIQSIFNTPAKPHPLATPSTTTPPPSTTKPTTATIQPKLPFMNDVEYDLRLRQLMEELVLGGQTYETMTSQINLQPQQATQTKLEIKYNSTNNPNTLPSFTTTNKNPLNQEENNSSSSSLTNSVLDYVLLEFITKNQHNLTQFSFDNFNSSKLSLNNVQTIQQQLEFLQKNAEKFKKFQQVQERGKNSTTPAGLDSLWQMVEIQGNSLNATTNKQLQMALVTNVTASQEIKPKIKTNLEDNSQLYSVAGTLSNESVTKINNNYSTPISLTEFLEKLSENDTNQMSSNVLEKNLTLFDGSTGLSPKENQTELGLNDAERFEGPQVQEALFDGNASMNAKESQKLMQNQTELDLNDLSYTKTIELGLSDKSNTKPNIERFEEPQIEEALFDGYTSMSAKESEKLRQNQTELDLSASNYTKPNTERFEIEEAAVALKSLTKEHKNYMQSEEIKMNPSDDLKALENSIQNPSGYLSDEGAQHSADNLMTLGSSTSNTPETALNPEAALTTITSQNTNDREFLETEPLVTTELPNLNSMTTTADTSDVSNSDQNSIKESLGNAAHEYLLTNKSEGLNRLQNYQDTSGSSSVWESNTYSNHTNNPEVISSLTGEHTFDQTTRLPTTTEPVEDSHTNLFTEVVTSQSLTDVFMDATKSQPSNLIEEFEQKEIVLTTEYSPMENSTENMYQVAIAVDFNDTSIDLFSKSAHLTEAIEAEGFESESTTNSNPYQTTTSPSEAKTIEVFDELAGSYNKSFRDVTTSSTLNEYEENEIILTTEYPPKENVSYLNNSTIKSSTKSAYLPESIAAERLDIPSSTNLNETQTKTFPSELKTIQLNEIVGDFYANSFMDAATSQLLTSIEELESSTKNDFEQTKLPFTTEYPRKDSSLEDVFETTAKMEASNSFNKTFIEAPHLTDTTEAEETTAEPYAYETTALPSAAENVQENVGNHVLEDNGFLTEKTVEPHSDMTFDLDLHEIKETTTVSTADLFDSTELSSENVIETQSVMPSTTTEFWTSDTTEIIENSFETVTETPTQIGNQYLNLTQDITPSHAATNANITSYHLADENVDFENINAQESFNKNANITGNIVPEVTSANLEEIYSTDHALSLATSKENSPPMDPLSLTAANVGISDNEMLSINDNEGEITTDASNVEEINANITEDITTVTNITEKMSTISSIPEESTTDSSITRKTFTDYTITGEITSTTAITDGNSQNSAIIEEISADDIIKEESVNNVNHNITPRTTITAKSTPDTTATSVTEGSSTDSTIKGEIPSTTAITDENTRESSITEEITTDGATTEETSPDNMNTERSPDYATAVEVIAEDSITEESATDSAITGESTTDYTITEDITSTAVLTDENTRDSTITEEITTDGASTDEISSNNTITEEINTDAATAEEITPGTTIAVESTPDYAITEKVTADDSNTEESATDFTIIRESTTDCTITEDITSTTAIADENTRDPTTTLEITTDDSTEETIKDESIIEKFTTNASIKEEITPDAAIVEEIPTSLSITAETTTDVRVTEENNYYRENNAITEEITTGVTSTEEMSPVNNITEDILTGLSFTAETTPDVSITEENNWDNAMTGEVTTGRTSTEEISSDNNITEEITTALLITAETTTDASITKANTYEDTITEKVTIDPATIKSIEDVNVKMNTKLIRYYNDSSSSNPNTPALDNSVDIPITTERLESIEDDTSTIGADSLVTIGPTLSSLNLRIVKNSIKETKENSNLIPPGNAIAIADDTGSQIKNDNNFSNSSEDKLFRFGTESSDTKEYENGNENIKENVQFNLLKVEDYSPKNSHGNTFLGIEPAVEIPSNQSERPNLNHTADKKEATDAVDNHEQILSFKKSSNRLSTLKGSNTENKIPLSQEESYETETPKESESNDDIRTVTEIVWLTQSSSIKKPAIIIDNVPYASSINRPLSKLSKDPAKLANPMNILKPSDSADNLSELIAIIGNTLHKSQATIDKDVTTKNQHKMENNDKNYKRKIIGEEVTATVNCHTTTMDFAVTGADISTIADKEIQTQDDGESLTSGNDNSWSAVGEENVQKWPAFINNQLNDDSLTKSGNVIMYQTTNDKHAAAAAAGDEVHDGDDDDEGNAATRKTNNERVTAELNANEENKENTKTGDNIGTVEMDNNDAGSTIQENKDWQATQIEGEINEMSTTIENKWSDIPKHKSNAITKTTISSPILYKKLEMLNKNAKTNEGNSNSNSNEDDQIHEDTEGFNSDRNNQSFTDMTLHNRHPQQHQQHLIPNLYPKPTLDKTLVLSDQTKEEITATNWWHSLPYTEIRKFLNSIFDSVAATTAADETLTGNTATAKPRAPGSITNNDNDSNKVKTIKGRKSKREQWPTWILNNIWSTLL